LTYKAVKGVNVAAKRKWTDAETQEIIQLYNDNVTISRIAKKYSAGTDTIRGLIDKLATQGLLSKRYIGVKPKTAHPDDRPCLKCKKLFRSEGAHNRICPSCNSCNKNYLENNNTVYLYAS